MLPSRVVDDSPSLSQHNAGFEAQDLLAVGNAARVAVGVVLNQDAQVVVVGVGDPQLALPLAAARTGIGVYKANHVVVERQQIGSAWREIHVLNSEHTVLELQRFNHA